jgi:hypothetical protein
VKRPGSVVSTDAPLLIWVAIIEKPSVFEEFVFNMGSDLPPLFPKKTTVNQVCQQRDGLFLQKLTNTQSCMDAITICLLGLLSRVCTQA